jgi:hypothetical protein
MIHFKLQKSRKFTEILEMKHGTLEFRRSLRSHSTQPRWLSPWSTYRPKAMETKAESNNLIPIDDICTGWTASVSVTSWWSTEGRFRWPRGLRRGSAAARLMRLRVRIPLGGWMSLVSVVCCQVEVSATTWSPEESYWLWCVVVSDLETSWMRRPKLALGRSTTRKRNV